MSKEIVVIGGGAAGMLCALSAAQNGASVTLLEQNQKVGRKLYITGKGRCNVTNDCSVEETLANIPRNSRFLMSAMTRFSPKDTQNLFASLGVPLKTERGSRVYPQSDKASDIIDTLFMALRRGRVSIVQERAEHIQVRQGAVCGVQGEHSSYPCQAVVIATGGASYPLTGSTGDGFRMAAELGHTVLELQPSLVPLVAEGNLCARMQGLSLKNVSVQARNGKGKTVYEEQGEMLFTHFGLSGPLILSASAHMRDYHKEHYSISIDLKPALEEQTLDARLVREFGEHANRAFHNVLEHLEPRLLVPVLTELSGIPAELPCHSVTREQRRSLVRLIKNLVIPIKGPRPLEEAIVTSGGIKVSEVDPKTMQSKLIPGLYFAGEVLDVDAYTGGFNLQIAWCTGRSAGLSAAAG